MFGLRDNGMLFTVEKKMVHMTRNRLNGEVPVVRFSNGRLSELTYLQLCYCCYCWYPQPASVHPIDNGPCQFPSTQLIDEIRITHNSYKCRNER